MATFITLVNNVLTELNEPTLSTSADLSAEKSLEILKKLKMPKLEINIITEAICNHSFTKKKISKIH